MNYQINGVTWNVTLDHNEVVTANYAAMVTAGLIPNHVGLALVAATWYMRVIDTVGGNNGVEVSGVTGALGVVVTPRGGSFYSILRSTAGSAVAAGTTIANFIVSAAMGGLADVAHFVAGNSAVVAAGVVGGPLAAGIVAGAQAIFGGEPPPRTRGAVKADRNSMQQWESFLLSTDGGSGVNLLSWQGFFCAEGGGGNEVWADRAQAGPWERWELVNNGDGSISLKSQNGYCFNAWNGGDDACYADAAGIQPTAKFSLTTTADGHVGLRTVIKNKWVSVQQ